MANKINIPKDNNIVSVPIEDAMPENYLPYAVEVAKDRALPDVRDGLKPVHRRILYGAYMLKAFPDKPYYKSARIVGDILGKYHPHGDTSVYDAMVILAQNFTTRCPLIDGHGNWGSQDGDGAAAMRYTEARLTPIAMEMLKDIDKDVVDMMENYSGSEMEPKVLPSKYPNLLVNGAFGIAVGLATNIPPHNLVEVIDGTLGYIDNNDITTEELMKYIKGPDLPTGGILIGKKSILSAYETGEGKVTLRAKTKIETLENGRLGIVITEFPYRKNKAKILQNISEMTGDKRYQKALESVTDIRDESDRTGIRAVIEFKKSVTKEEVEKIRKYLFKKTDLQSNLSFNMVALADGKPLTMGIKTIIKYYVDHQKEIIKRRTEKELDTAKKRFNIVEGFIKAIGIMDEVIKAIRASKSKKDSIENLQKQFGFGFEQAQAIVELMLYRLTGLEIEEFKKEHRQLEKLISKLEKILANEKELLKVVKAELTDIKRKYSDKRRTSIVENESEAQIDIEELIPAEDTIITVSKEGYIKRVSKKSYDRSNTDKQDIEYREGDSLKFLLKSNTKHKILIFMDSGNMYQMRGEAVPEYKWKEKGEKIDTIIRGIDLQNEKIINVFSVEDLNTDEIFSFVSDNGYIKNTKISEFISNYSKIMALKLKDDGKLIFVRLMKPNESYGGIKVKTLNGINFILKKPEVEVSKRSIVGSKLFNLAQNDKIIDLDFVEKYDNEEFYAGINEKGIISISKNYKNRISFKECKTDSESTILAFTNKGNVINISSCMLLNITAEQATISLLNNEFDCNNEKILNIISVKDYKEPYDIYFFTKDGLIKKVKLEEFKGDYTSLTAYKFRNNDDILINVDYYERNSKCDIIIITEKGMCIRFSSDNISYMGRVASGVTGISLSEEDMAAYGAVCKENYKSIILKSENKNVKEISLNEVKVQNRAGRGKNIMLLILDDVIKQIRLK